MSFFKKIFGSARQDTTAPSVISDNESAASIHDPGADIDEEVIAAIMAATISVMGTGASDNLRIRSIRRIGRNAPIWCTAGRDTYMASRL